MRTPQSIQRTYSSSTIKRYIAAVVMLSITLPLLYIGGLTLALFITFLWMGLLYELWKTSTQNTFATWVIRFIGTTLVINTWLFAIYMVLVIPIGFRFLAFLLPSIWLTDSLAYAGGRYLKGPLLAPKISPQKTWSGFGIGLLGGSTWSLLYITIYTPHTMLAWTLATTLPVVATLSDLSVSKGKRLLGMKDSSALIPGHGGLWDRLDSTLGVLLFLSVLCTFYPEEITAFLRCFDKL